MEESNYHRTEAGIVQKRTWIRLFMKVLLPILILFILLLAIYYRYRFMQSVTSTRVFPKNSRLYEIPNDVAPLLMASIVYSTELDEISPTKKHARGAFKFDQLVQATLLDLIDRKNIICEQYDTHTVLTIQNEDTLDEFEREFLRLAFGSQKYCRTDDLFQIMKFRILSINMRLRKSKMPFAREENKRKIGLMQRFLVSLRQFNKRSKPLPFLLTTVL